MQLRFIYGFRESSILRWQVTVGDGCTTLDSGIHGAIFPLVHRGSGLVEDLVRLTWLTRRKRSVRRGRESVSQSVEGNGTSKGTAEKKDASVSTESPHGRCDSSSRMWLRVRPTDPEAIARLDGRTSYSKAGDTGLGHFRGRRGQFR